MKVRYIKCSQKGSTISSACHWQEIKVIDFVGENVAIGLPVASSEPFSTTSSPSNIITDGDLHENDPNIFSTITNSSKVSQWVKIDLGSIIDVASLNVWHYFLDGRITKGVKFEVSSDNTNWTTVFDSSIDGEYQETIDGKCIYFESSLDDNTELYLELNDFSDSSNYKRAITNNNTTIDNNGKFGKCAKMSNSRINVGNFKTRQNKITIDFWIKLNSHNDYPTPFSLYKNGSVSRGIYSHVASGNISLVTPGGNVNMSTGSSVPLNTWTHLAYVIDETIGRIYVNGKKIGQGTVSSMDFDSVVVGCLYNGNNAFSANMNGYIDEFRISSVARYHDDFEVPTKPYSGLALPVNSSIKDTIDAVGDIKNELAVLKCNLKTNLQNKGIEVLPTDKMSNLIDKVGTIATGLEIKHCTTLPSIVKNDDFYVLSNTSVNNIYIKHYEGENSSLANAGDYQDGDVLVLFDKTINGLTKIFDFTSKNTRTIFNVMKVLQVINNKYVQVEVYEGINGKWEQVVNKEYTVFSHGIYMQELETGQIDAISLDGYNGDNSMSAIDKFHKLHVKNIDGALEVSVDKYTTDSYGYLYKSYHTSKDIDFTPYRRLVVEFEKVKQNNNYDEGCSMSIGVRDSVNNNSLNIGSTVKGNIAMGNHTIDLDISNYAKIGRLVFRLYIEGGQSTIPGFICNVKKITLLT